MDKNSYALGMSIAHNMMQSGIQSIDFDDLAAGVKAVLTGAEPAVSFKEAGELLDKYFAEIEPEQEAQAEVMSATMPEKGEVKDEFELPEKIFIWEGPDSSPDLMQKNHEQLAKLRDYAEKGYAKAQFLLGYYYEHGLENQVESACLYYRYVRQDEDKAMEWYELAARQGYPPAVQKVGVK